MEEDFFEEELDDEVMENEEVQEENAPSKTETPKQNPYEKLVQDYLEKEIETDESLKSNYIENRISQCFKYITSCAQKFKVGNCAMIEDNVVYKWARDYFNDGIAKTELEQQKVKDEKEKAKKERAETERKKAEAEKKRQQEYAEFMARPVEVVPLTERQKELKRLENATQLSLFDF